MVGWKANRNEIPKPNNWNKSHNYNALYNPYAYKKFSTSLWMKLQLSKLYNFLVCLDKVSAGIMINKWTSFLLTRALYYKICKFGSDHVVFI